MCIDSTHYTLTDFKKTLLELRLQGTINDKFKKCAGYLFKIKFDTNGDGETIAEWFEGKSAGSNGKIMKKIRFPLKFQYFNSNVRVHGYFDIRCIDCVRGDAEY